MTKKYVNKLGMGVTIVIQTGYGLQIKAKAPREMATNSAAAKRSTWAD